MSLIDNADRLGRPTTELSLSSHESGNFGTCCTVARPYAPLSAALLVLKDLDSCCSMTCVFFDFSFLMITYRP